MKRRRRHAPPPFWRSALLTFVCAGAVLFLHWLSATKVVSDVALTLTIVFIIPVAAFVFAGDGLGMVGRDLRRQKNLFPRTDRKRPRSSSTTPQISDRSVQPVMNKNQLSDIEEETRYSR